SAQGRQALPHAVLETVTSLALAIDAKDHYTQGHSQKVSAYAALVAEAMGIKDEEMEEIRLGAVLHDIGKVGIPESILSKNGPLNPEEWETMKAHVKFGAKILDPLTPLARIREMVLHHHEFFDGSGYPDALTGENIPLGARIIAIADAYDTITSDRTYKRARKAMVALAELERCANAHRAGGRGNFSDRGRLRRHGADKKFHDGSVKLRIRAALQLGQSVHGFTGPLVRAVAGDGVVGVGDGNDARAQGNVLPGQCVRIARAVEEFVVVKNHFADTRERRQRVEDLGAKLHVCLHGLPLFGIERAVLAQDAFRNTDLADVVKHGTQTNLFHFLVFDPHGFCDQRRIGGD